SSLVGRSVTDGSWIGNWRSVGFWTSSKVSGPDVSDRSTAVPLIEPEKANVYAPGWVGMNAATYCPGLSGIGSNERSFDWFPNFTDPLSESLTFTGRPFEACVTSKNTPFWNPEIAGSL